jgi:hypothetical protein
LRNFFAMVKLRIRVMSGYGTAASGAKRSFGHRCLSPRQCDKTGTIQFTLVNSDLLSLAKNHSSTREAWEVDELTEGVWIGVRPAEKLWL